jgi:curved DNA-binding protein CbpA
MAHDPYAVLGVDPGTDMAQLRRVYLAELRRNHPDLRPGDDAAAARTRDLNHAWEQIRRRRSIRPQPGQRPRTPPRPQPAYSSDQRDFRVAFTSASLRIALALLAFGLPLLAALVR